MEDYVRLIGILLLLSGITYYCSSKFSQQPGIEWAHTQARIHREKAERAYAQLAARGAERRLPETEDEASLVRLMNRELDLAVQNAQEAAFIEQDLAMHVTYAVTLAILGLILTLVGLYRKHRQLNAHLWPYPQSPSARAPSPLPIQPQAWTPASR